MLKNLLLSLFLISIALLPNSIFATKTTDKIKTSVSPSSNFYAWVNKKWLARTRIPDDKMSVSNFTTIQENVFNQLRALITSFKNKKKRTPDEEKILNFYLSYTGMKKRDSLALSPIASDLKAIDSAKTHKDIIQLFAKFQMQGVRTPYLYTVDIDYKNSKIYRLFVVQAGLGVNRDHYLGSDKRSKRQIKLYKEVLKKLFSLASVKTSVHTIELIIKLETEMAKIQWSKVKNRDPLKTHNNLNYKEVEKITSNLHTQDYLKSLGYPARGNINVMQPSYISRFNDLFRKTQLHVWKNYLRACLLTDYATLLTSEFKKVWANYEIKKGLFINETALWQQAIASLNMHAGLLLGKAYVNRYFNEDSKVIVTKLIREIVTEYKNSIIVSTRLSLETKKKALVKLAKMKFQIAYPKKWRDYSSLTITRQDLLANSKRLIEYEHKRNIKKLDKPVDNSDWYISPQEVNAYYSPSMNTFILLAAIMQNEFVDTKGNHAVNYAGIGFIISHEIAHGFDDSGRRFDAEGNLKNWWTDIDAKKYDVIKQKLINQANKYEVLPGVFLNGELEVGEIIGDLSGAEIAYKAYKRMLSAKGMNNQSEKKKFFIQLAKTWRSKIRKQVLLKYLESDTHPPSEYRANGIVVHFDDFHELFNTKQGDRMYKAPSERIRIW